MNQRGVALITAIVMVALATILAVRLAKEGALDQRRTAATLVLEQARQYAMGAEAWATEILRDDATRNDQDDFGEDWAKPVPPLPIEGGTLSGQMEDMQGRFNINTLVKADGTADPAAVETFERLLERLHLDVKWARMLADWLDADTVPDFQRGAEDGVYLAQTPPYRTANGPVSSTSELLALPGFSLAEFRVLAPHVAALPVDVRRINLCTATGPVLASLSPEAADFGAAEALAQNRRGGCFPSIEDLRATLSDAEFRRIETQVSQASAWFRLRTVVRIGTMELTLYSLLERGNGPPRAVLRSIGSE
ncbi:MAG: type II secretion system minor pseudopilin GspK [Steroidobacteraceae bacterium]